MTRRDLLRRAALAVAIPVVQPSQSGAPVAPKPLPPGDRLYDPSMVQQRAAASAADNDPDIKALEHRLKCTCGCNLDIYTCRTTDFTCTYSPQLHGEVVALRQAGKSPDAIVAAFVAKYGEQVLMAPAPRGFNLAGYLLPGALVLLAGALLTLLLVRRGRLARAPQPAPAAAGAPTGQDAERLRRALADVED